MPTFQVTRRELVYVDRTYEVEAASETAALDAVKRDEGELVDEQMQDTHSVADKPAYWQVAENT